MRPRGSVLHQHRVRLSYADTDPAGILYYAAWFAKMEAVQSEFLFLQGLRQDTLAERFGWWTVSRATQCEYLVAAKLFDEIDIELRLGEIGATSFRFDFEMRRVFDGLVVARASNTAVTVDLQQRAVSIPSELRKHLETWLEDRRPEERE